MHSVFMLILTRPKLHENTDIAINWMQNRGPKYMPTRIARTRTHLVHKSNTATFIHLFILFTKNKNKNMQNFAFYLTKSDCTLAYRRNNHERKRLTNQIHCCRVEFVTKHRMYNLSGWYSSNVGDKCVSIGIHKLCI